MLSNQNMHVLAIVNLETGVALNSLRSTAVATAGAATFTAAAVLGGLIQRNTNGANRTDTLPTAVLLIAAIRSEAQKRGLPNVPAVLAFDLVIINTTVAAETITVAAGTGGSVAAGHTMTIGQNESKRFNIQFSNTATPAYVVRNFGGWTT